DLHAADPSSLSMLHFFAHELTAARILLLGVHRKPLHGATRDVLDLLARLTRAATVVRLPRLTRDEVGDLVEARGRPMPPALVDRIFGTSEGVPFLVEEMRRLLLRPDALWLSGTPLPTGVRSIIRDRIVELDEETQEQLAIASVVGTTFTLALVGLLSPEVDATRVHELVERAAQADVVDRVAPGRYAFSHAMLREALYREIPGGR